MIADASIFLQKKSKYSLNQIRFSLSQVFHRNIVNYL
jgi:hypothetical protein